MSTPPLGGPGDAGSAAPGGPGDLLPRVNLVPTGVGADVEPEPAPEPDDDAALMARHLAGDPQAFGLLVARHRDRAWALALRTLGNPEAAADAVQDAFLSAYRGAASFRSEARFSTWLHRIVVNACLDRVRREAARPTVPLDEERAAAIVDPRDAIERSDTIADVQAALARLSEEQRFAVVLVDVEGLPVEEAARVLGIPVGTVKSRCYRGRAALAIHLGHLRPRPAGGTAPPPPASNLHRPEQQPPASASAPPPSAPRAGAPTPPDGP